MTDTLAPKGEGAACAPKRLYGFFSCDNSKLFWLVVWTGALTVVTLGIYRFWARTRLRRYIWSSIMPGGDSFEYTGKGLEKFLGFLIALVVLAVYLGLLQIVLSFVGFNLWGAISSEPNFPKDMLMQTAATYAVGLAVMPLIFFAQYRARRYMLSRTRWRGLRFAMDAATLGYVWRALLYYGMSLVTLGALMPLATFRLEKYMTDRMRYGDAGFEQEGQWTALYPAMRHLFIAAAVLLLSGVVSYLEQSLKLFTITILAGYLWLFLGFVYYQVESFKYLTAHKLLDGQVRFTSEASAGQVLGIIVLGLIVITILSFIVGFFSVLSLGAFVAVASFAGVGVFGVVALGYFAFIVLVGAVVTVLISAPILGHYVHTLWVENAELLEQIRQRTGEHIADADGFADALDIGGAF